MSTVITVPHTKIHKTKLGTVALTWKRDFPEKWQRRHINAQVDMGHEILRLSEPFIPKKTGFLISSGEVQEHVNNAEVEWGAPYARYQYFSARAVGSATGPHRGPYWFERMRSLYKKYLIDRAKAVLKGLRKPRRPRKL